MPRRTHPRQPRRSVITPEPPQLTPVQLAHQLVTRGLCPPSILGPEQSASREDRVEDPRQTSDRGVAQ